MAVLITKNKFPGFRALAEIEPDIITDDCIGRAFSFVCQIYQSMGSSDKVAKGQEMIKRIKIDLDHLLSDSAL